MERFDEFVIVIDVFYIIELLQHKVTGVVKNIGSFVISSSFQKALKGHPIVKVFPWVDFITDINTILIEGVEYRQPSVGQFFKSHFHETLGTLRPGMPSVPQQSTGESGMGGQPKSVACFRSFFKGFNGPVSSRFGIIFLCFRGKVVKH